MSACVYHSHTCRAQRKTHGNHFSLSTMWQVPLPCGHPHLYVLEQGFPHNLWHVTWATLASQLPWGPIQAPPPECWLESHGPEALESALPVWVAAVLTTVPSPYPNSIFKSPHSLPSPPAALHYCPSIFAYLCQMQTATREIAWPSVLHGAGLKSCPRTLSHLSLGEALLTVQWGLRDPKREHRI